MLLKIHGKIGFAKIFKNSAGYTDLKIHQSNYVYGMLKLVARISKKLFVTLFIMFEIPI